jgi:hypothetical protein
MSVMIASSAWPSTGMKSRDDIERHREVGEEQPQTDARASRDGTVRRQILEQPQRVRQQPHRFAEECAPGPNDKQRRYEQQPRREERDYHTDNDPLQRHPTLRSVRECSASALHGSWWRPAVRSPLVAFCLTSDLNVTGDVEVAWANRARATPERAMWPKRSGSVEAR